MEDGTKILLGGSKRGAVVGSLPGSQALGVGVGRRNLLGGGGGNGEVLECGLEELEEGTEVAEGREDGCKLIV